MAIRGNKKRIHQCWIIALALMLGFLFSSTSPVYAQTCQIQNTFPTNTSGVVNSEFGDRRGDGTQRKHTGVDLFYPQGTRVQIPSGCKIKPQSNGSVIWENPGGYGYYMYIDCGTTATGDSITLRYAHIPQNGYNASTTEILQGNSGNASGGLHHYHFEIIIGDRPVDPECVLGMVKTNQNADTASAACKACPIGAGPANLCDTGVVGALINHSVECTKTAKYPNGQTKSVPGGTSIDPNSIRNSGITGDADPNSTVTDPGHTHEGDNDEVFPDIDDSGGGYTGSEENFIDTFYPGEEEEPFVEPPVPPGERGDPAELTPAPEGGTDEEVSGCATDTWHSMVNQAVLESRRETALNQRFIAKPDSVFPYVCFETHLKATEKAAPIFSGNQLWNPKDIDILGKVVTVEVDMSNPGLKGALDVVVRNSLATYLDTNFNHGLLGETAGSTTPPALDTCGIMKQVWEMAKCKNFEDPTVFYKFEDLIGTDPRIYPASLKCE